MPVVRAPRHATGSLELVPLDDLSDDVTFRLRETGDVARLAVSMGRLGQLAPVELRPLPGSGGEAGPTRWQVVAGFRRVEALRMLQRERVLARVHPELPDEDAWILALAEPLFATPWADAELEALRGRVRSLLPWAEADLKAARAAGKGARGGDEKADPREKGAAGREKGAAAAAPERIPTTVAELPEAQAVPIEEMGRNLAIRVWEVNQEMADAIEAWRELPVAGRRQIVEQLRYLAEIFPVLARETE
jgi:ParB-like chromosome segregation protein Spo0J